MMRSKSRRLALLVALALATALGAAPAAIAAPERAAAREPTLQRTLDEVVAAGAAGVATTLSAGATAAGAAPYRAKLQRAADALVAAGAPGTIVLIRDGDRTTRLVAGDANLATRRPVRASDRFRVGSTTKTFVSAVVLELASEGTLTLDDWSSRVARYPPG
jgi:CubicO group peptidase (beta-lactamase class C family)